METNSFIVIEKKAGETHFYTAYTAFDVYIEVFATGQILVNAIVPCNQGEEVKEVITIHVFPPTSSVTVHVVNCPGEYDLIPFDLISYRNGN